MKVKSILMCVVLLHTSASYAQEKDAEEDAWDDEWEESWEEESSHPWNGFIEYAGARRTQNDAGIDETDILSELRFRLEGDGEWKKLAWSLKADVWRDQTLNETEYKFREAAISFSLGDATDIKAGRQVLTWGTGDLLFLNDLFPKDFTFFAGRDDEYLKAPSDALRVSHYSALANIDFAIMPRFASDEYFTGERFSFFLPAQGQIGAPDPIISDDKPSNLEYALRLFKNVQGIEWALYSYYGFYKQPNELKDDGDFTFAPLASVGASLRSPMFGGIGNIEATWYHSRDEDDGSNPRLPNDQIRMLLGYEREIVTNFTASFQYFFEKTLDYNSLIDNSPIPQFEVEKFRYLFTNRLTWRSQRNQLVASIFSLYSPSDQDYYLRPQISYRPDDSWLFTSGGNAFGGENKNTLFAQLEDNSNLFIRLRYHY